MKKAFSTGIALFFILSALPIFATPEDTIDGVTAWKNDCRTRYDQTITGITEQYGEEPSISKWRKARDAARTSAKKIRDDCIKAADKAAQNYDNAMGEAESAQDIVDENNHNIWTSPKANPRDSRYDKKTKDTWIRERDAAKQDYVDAIDRAESEFREAKWKKIPPTCNELDEYERMIHRNYRKAIDGLSAKDRKVDAAWNEFLKKDAQLTNWRERCMAVALEVNQSQSTTGTDTTPPLCQQPPLNSSAKIPALETTSCDRRTEDKNDIVLGFNTLLKELNNAMNTQNQLQTTALADLNAALTSSKTQESARAVWETMNFAVMSLKEQLTTATKASRKGKSDATNNFLNVINNAYNRSNKD